MKKINRGFTLIELLGVIVILSLMMVIATILIINVLHDYKISAYKISVDRIVEALELKMIKNEQFSFNDGQYLIIPFASIAMENNSNLKSPFWKLYKK